jgi:DNA-binding NarL/FixJ family response regulator
MKKIDVILVDDHALFLNGLNASLKNYAFINVLSTFTKAETAINFLKTTAVDLIISDISMPNINGFEFIKKVKSIHNNVKVLVISMFEPLHYKRNFYNGYLLKDTDITTVVKAIETIVYEHKTFFYDDITSSDEFVFTKNIVTKREKEIIQLITQEKTVEEIAEQLFLSRHTIETHKKNIFFKLQVKSNAGLVKKAIVLGVI